MAVTYEQARDIVRQELQPDWTRGTFCVDDRAIFENDEMYVFNVGAREWFVDGDPAFRIRAGVLPVVYKEDGRLERLPSVTLAMDDSIQERPNPSPTLGT